MYVGFYAGGVWGRGKTSANTNCPELNPAGTIGGYYCDSTAPASRANATAVTNAASGSLSSTKFTGGVQAGHNWQIGSFVYGIEGDFGAFKLNGARSVSDVYGASVGSAVNIGDRFVVGNSINTDWLLTARGRIGWTHSNWLVFATGGLAVSRVTVTTTFSDNHAAGGISGANRSASESKNKVGWTLGGGMEVALTRHWSLKGEYLYIDLGSLGVVANVAHPGIPPGVGYSNALGVSTDLAAHIARLGANFRF
jgi:outer membrane immunogenic protein